MVNNFWKALSDVPAVDINFFGLPNEFEPRFVRRVYGTLEASCIFFRDSGDESALAESAQE